MSEYDLAGVVTEVELEEMIALAIYLKRRVEEWLRTAHPELVPADR